MYTGPPPSAPTYSTPTIPPLSILSRSIIQSSAKLFFISHSIGTNGAREWRLVRVAFEESTSSKPIVKCSTTHFRALMCHHILFMSTAEHM
jgi:hypothetical protein